MPGENIAAICRPHGAGTPIPGSPSIGAAPKTVATGICLHEPEIVAARTEGGRVSRQDVAAVWSTLNSAAHILATPSECSAPETVAICVRFDEPEVVLARTEGAGPTAEGVTAIRSWLNRLAGFVVGSPVGAAPEAVAVSAGLHQPEIVLSRAERPGFSRQDIATDCARFNRKGHAILVVSTTERTAPQTVAVRICLHQPEIVATSPERTGLSRQGIAAILSALNRVAVLVGAPSVGAAPEAIGRASAHDANR